MATSSSSSISATLLPLCNSSISSRPTSKSSFFSLPLNTLKLQPLKSTHSTSSTKTFAAPELLEGTIEPPTEIPDEALELGGSETPGTSRIVVEGDVDKMAPKQKIRIKLRSYWVPLIEDSCKQIMDAARTSNAKTMGPVPLPTKKRIYCVLKSPHVHKDARFHFEIRTHQRLIDILYPTAQTIDSLMQLDLPAGVDVEVKL
ncbi:30S ribosomal protein S10 [Thalictrum thalictroides]|uniref:Small ribosomal subunit protein uS10c n=1 Tax=Thalictrum thalictroides TaxID=46969 RepID=A0A7J6XAR5_THATH|nr:30S ribosomal protein S10 [Thalictrum thalictroides]